MRIGYDLEECLIASIQSTVGEKGVQMLSLNHIAKYAVDTVMKMGIEIHSDVPKILEEMVSEIPYIKKEIIWSKDDTVSNLESFGDLDESSLLGSILNVIIANNHISFTPIGKSVMEFFGSYEKMLHNDNIKIDCLMCFDIIKAIRLYSSTVVGDLFRHYDILSNSRSMEFISLRQTIEKKSHDILKDWVGDNKPDTKKETMDKKDNRQNENLKTSLLQKIEELKTYNMIDEIVGRNFNTDPVIGREKEINLIAEKMLKKKRSNVVLLGEPGVGKTEVVNGLAYRIANGLIGGEIADDYKIYSINVMSLMAGTKFRGELEAKLQVISDLLSGLSQFTDIILYIDEIHLIVGTGAGGDGGADIGNLLKPTLTGGKIKVIGSTTFEEYNAIKKDKALNRRFETVSLDEPSQEDTIKILLGIQPEYEKYFGIKMPKKLITKIVSLTGAYIKDKFYPDKAIEAMDSTMAYCKFNRMESVTEEAIVHTISEMSRIDISRIKINSDDVVNLGDTVKKSLFGQDKAVEKMVNIIKTYKAGFNDETKTIANVLFCGKTGTGKTELSKLIASSMDWKFLRFDMSEYQEEYTVSKLIGSPAGYVGHNEGGLLTEAISKDPHCVLLLDEIEKAHPKVMDVLLQIMDYGCLTDSVGKKVDFTNVLLIMTSNAGVDFKATHKLGFGAVEDNTNDDIVSIEKYFKPEFLGRLEEIIKFNDISEEVAKLVLEKELNKVYIKAQKKGYTVDITDSVKEEVLKKSNIKKLGARNISKEVQKSIVPLVVDCILSNQDSKVIRINNI